MLSRLKTAAAVALLAAAVASSAAAIASLVASPAANAAANPVSTRNTAPEFTGIDTWLNSEPLTMQQLRGKVVLVDF